MSGFGNSFETDALPGALPVGRNSPQKVAYGLYAEQLSGSPFTAPQATNQRSWLYRIRPTVRHVGRLARIDRGNIRTAPEREDGSQMLIQRRWGPVPIPSDQRTFVTGLSTVTTAGGCRGDDGHGGTSSIHHPIDDARTLLRCRRRAVGGGTARRPA